MSKKTVMKNFILRLALILIGISPFKIFAQDLIILRNGEEIQGNVIQITLTKIEYTKDSSRYPVISLPITQVFQVKFKEGQKKTFTDQDYEIAKKEENSMLKNNTPDGLSNYQNKAAGEELMKASKHYYLGLGMLVGGAFVSAVGGSIGNSTNNGEGGIGFYLIGGAVTLVGEVLILESYSHIGKAGKILNGESRVSAGVTSTGIGLSYKF